MTLTCKNILEDTFKESFLTETFTLQPLAEGDLRELGKRPKEMFSFGIGKSEILKFHDPHYPRDHTFQGNNALLVEVPYLTNIILMCLTKIL